MRRVRKTFSGHKILYLLLCEIEMFENSILNQGKRLETKSHLF